MINILVADDQELACIGIRNILSDIPKMRVVAIAHSGEEAVQIASQKHPNVILMDLEMPGNGGLWATEQILIENPNAKIIILSSHTGESYMDKALEIGAKGYLTKDAKPSDMIEAIHDVLAGKPYLNRSMAQNAALKKYIVKQHDGFASLTKPENEVLHLIIRGWNVINISKTLLLSTKTIRAHRKSLLINLKCDNDVELTILALKCGIVQVDDLTLNFKI